MVHPNGFLEEEDIAADEEAMEGGSETGGAPSVTDSLLDYDMDIETGSQQSKGNVDWMDDLSHTSPLAPSSAASQLSRHSLDLFGQSVRLNSEVGSSSVG